MWVVEYLNAQTHIWVKAVAWDFAGQTSVSNHFVSYGLNFGY